MRHTILWLAVWAAGPLGLAAVERAEPTGHWEGVLKAGGIELRLVLNVTKDGDGLKGTFDSPDQGSMGLVVDAVKVEGNVFTFGLKAIKGEYKGTLNAEGTEVVGTWSQAGRSTPMTLKKTETPARLNIPAELIGTWEGSIPVDDKTAIRLQLRVVKGKDGSMTVFFASPDQGAAFLPINAISLAGATLTAESKPIAARYVGTLNAAKTEIDGTWTQGVKGVPLRLKKTDKPSEPKRSQVVKPPFPYKTEDVTYANKAAGLSLAGTLSLPEGTGPFPAALLITGSGPQDRDETLMGHKPFLVIADALTRRGVAVLRVDDRGVGQSTGTQHDATSDDFAGDVLAGVAYLKSRAEIDPKAIGLIGHSEGGLIAPMVATRSSDVAFIVLLAGTGIDGGAILKEQGRLIMKAQGASEAALAGQAKLMTEILAVIQEESDPKAAEPRLKALSKRVVELLPEGDRKALGELVGQSAEAQIQIVNSPWFRYFLKYDPRSTLAKVRCPVLAINGEKDLQVPSRANLDAIEAALKSGGNTRVTIRELPGLNHLFQACKTGSPSEYASIEETVNPSVLTLLGDWILATTGRK